MSVRMEEFPNSPSEPQQSDLRVLRETITDSALREGEVTLEGQ